MRSLILIVALLTSPAYAGDVVEPKIPTKFGCAIARSLYKHYIHQYTIDQMKDFLRSKGVSEARIAGAEKCLS